MWQLDLTIRKEPEPVPEPTPEPTPEPAPETSSKAAPAPTATR